MFSVLTQLWKIHLIHEQESTLSFIQSIHNYERVTKVCNIQVHLNKLECRGKVHLFQ